MERIYYFIVHRPKTVLLFILLLTGFLAYHAQHIRLDSSVESLLPQDDPEKRYYDEVRQLFISDEMGIIGLIADDIYTPEVLQKIKHLTEEIQKIDGVEDVISLTNAVDPIADVVDPPLLVPQIPSTPEALEKLKTTLADRPIYQKNLVSPDGRAAAINILFADTNDDAFRQRVDEKIQALVARESGPEKLYYTGLPHFKVYSAKVMWEDVSRFVPVTLLLIIVVLFFCFRSLRGVLLPAATVIISLVWTLGIMVLSGSHLSLGSIALPPLLLVLGTAYSLHMVAEYYELARPGRSRSEVLLETLGKTTAPIFITALTTVLGFLSLGVNRIVSIREMGLYSSVGIVIAFALSVVVVPAVLALLPLPARQETAFSPALSSALRELGQVDIRHRKAIILAGIVIAALSVWQIFSIRVDSNFQSFFRPEDPIRQATDAINRHLAGSMAFYVVIDGNRKDLFKEWDTLRRMKDLQLYLDALPGVEKTLSFVDYCELLDRGAQEGGGGLLVSPEGEIIEAPPPEERKTFWEEPAQLKAVMQLVAGSPKSFAWVVNPEFSRTNILVRTALSRSSDIMDLVAKIRAFGQEHFPPELTVHPTGNLILLTHTTGDIVTGQIQSLSLAGGVIFAIMAAMFLSARVGLIAMIPNLFPILAFFGVMGASGAVLNLGTSIIASIALGIAVDNTIHLMTRLSSEVRVAADQEQALLQTLAAVGKPSLYASVILFWGFLVLYLSTFVPIQEFGLLSAFTIVVAFVGDVVLLPALLATTRIITVWDLLYLKLGKDPHKTIPLFEGLRPLQARIVTLMGEIKAFPCGQPIIRQGEMGNEMYVLINGTADVIINSSSQPRRVRTLGRGDVFGEMGLIRHHVRTADVIATEDVEVIAVNGRFLSHMQRRYPRIGSKIFLNIAKILSDRLQAESHRLAG
jgi:predicted RND superfamily exporter protein